MSRRVIPGLEAPDAALEAEIRGRLDRVEAALEKAVHGRRSGLLSETSHVPARRRREALPRRCSSCSPATSATRPTRG